METTPSTRSTEMTEVLSGEEHVMSTMLKFLSKAHKIDSCGDYKAPSLILEVRQYKKLLSDIKAKPIQLRYITDITKDNIHYCKELLQFANEVRHLAGMRANFQLVKRKYIASASIQQQQQEEEEQEHESRPSSFNLTSEKRRM
jgi:two-component system, OmpR family, sensor histidine kinase VicK